MHGEFGIVRRGLARQGDSTYDLPLWFHMHRRAFTLVELLVVIAIIGILAAVVAGDPGRGVKQGAAIPMSESLKESRFGVPQLRILKKRLPPGFVNYRT